jgi:hypothetical protein
LRKITTWNRKEQKWKKVVTEKIKEDWASLKW